MTDMRDAPGYDEKIWLAVNQLSNATNKGHCILVVTVDPDTKLMTTTVCGPQQFEIEVAIMLAERITGAPFEQTMTRAIATIGETALVDLVRKPT